MLPKKISSPCSFSEAWDLVWERKFKFLSEPTNELKRYQKHLEDKIGHLKLEDINPVIVQEIASHLTEENYQPQTIKQVVGLISRIFNQLIKWGLCCHSNPVAGISIPKSDNRRQRYLTSEEAERLLAALKERSENTWALALLSLSTGMRLGEMLKLKGEHVNLAKGTIRIVDPKSKRNRTVFLPNAASAMLASFNPKPGEFIFKNPQGEPFKTVSDTYARVVEKLGFNKGISDAQDKVVFHSLRHTFASWMAQDDQSVFLVAELLGHSSLEMTRRYSHLSPEKKRVATSTINNHIPLYYTQNIEGKQDKFAQPSQNVPCPPNNLKMNN